MGTFESLVAVVLLVFALFVVSSFARILREYERAVIFRLGRSTRAILNPGGQGNGPGLVLLVPMIDRMVKVRSEEHTSELQSQSNLVCRLLLEKKKKK